MGRNIEWETRLHIRQVSPEASFLLPLPWWQAHSLPASSTSELRPALSAPRLVEGAELLSVTLWPSVTSLTLELITSLPSGSL